MLLKDVGSKLNEKAKHIYPTMSTEEIQNILDSYREIMFVNGVFNVNPLFIKSNTVIYMSPNTIIQANIGFGANDCVLTMKDVSNITIYGNHAIVKMLKSEYATGEWRHGVYMLSANNITINDFHSNDSGGDGFYIGASTPTGFCDGIVLNNCFSDNNKRQGLSITSGKNIYVYGGKYSGTIGANPQFGIDIEPNLATNFIENVNLIGVKTSNNSGGGISVVPNQLVNTISINITDCISIDDRMGLFFTNPHDSIKLSGNITVNNFKHYNTKGSGIVFRGWNEYSAKVILEDCYGENVGYTLSGTPNRCGIYFSVEVSSWGTWFGNVEIINYELNDTRTTPLTYIPVYFYDLKNTLLKNIYIYNTKANIWTYEPNNVKITPVILHPKYEDCTIKYENGYNIEPISSRVLYSSYYSGANIKNSNTILTPLYTLPQCSDCVGMEITFDVDVAGGYISIIPQPTDIIKLKSKDVGGGIASTLKGSHIKLKCVSNTEWRIIEEIGDWVISGFTQLRYPTMSHNKVPTTGAWLVGDSITNSAPTIAKNIVKWTCITSGTPGTWVAYGTGWGTTAQRPTLTGNDQGYTFYDTTLAKNILWNGSAWLV